MKTILINGSVIALRNVAVINPIQRDFIASEDEDRYRFTIIAGGEYWEYRGTLAQCSENRNELIAEIEAL